MSEKVTDSKRRPGAAAKVIWDKANTTQFKVKLNNNTDAELIAHLKAVPNRQGYIKRLILEDMSRQHSPD